jgi:type I restriction enzyme R subunit
MLDQVPAGEAPESCGMDKKKLSEADICLKFITPALVASGWDVDAQVFQEFTLKAGRMVVRGQRAARDKASIRRADTCCVATPIGPSR